RPSRPESPRHVAGSVASCTPPPCDPFPTSIARTFSPWLRMTGRPAPAPSPSAWVSTPHTQASTAVGSYATGSSTPPDQGTFVSPSPTPQTTCANTPLTTLWEDSTTGPEEQSRADSRLRTSSPSASPFVA